MAEDLAVDYPVGISLGHKTLISAYYNTKNELQIITSIPSSEEWQYYFIDTMKDLRNHRPYDDPKSKALMAGTISSIVTATAMALSLDNSDCNSLRIRSIAYPQQFGAFCVLNILRIAEERGCITMGSQVMKHFSSARLAYGLDTCAGCGLPDGSNLDEGENFMLVVDLGTTHLTLGFTNTGTNSLAPVRLRHWTDFRSNVSENTSNETPQLVPPSTVKFIQDFLAEQLQLDRLVRDVTYRLTHVVAVILMGEASPAAMEEMKITLESATPEFADRFKFTIDPMHVAVQGVARRAKQCVTEFARYEPVATARYR